MNEIQEVLSERNKSYGDYKGGVELRVRIMSLITIRYQEVHGKIMDLEHESMIFDIVNKLTRIAVTPDHVDSWVDIAGYSTLISNLLKEDKNADKQRTSKSTISS